MTSLDDLGADLLKTFGNALKTRNQKARFFSTGFPPLDKIISGSYSGGVPSGRIIEIFGASQTGKTHLAVEIMKSAQAQGGATIFLDYERRFVPEFAERRGLNLEAPHFIYLQPRTWEEGNSQAIAIAEKIRTSEAFIKDAPIVCVLDSVASANPRSKLDGSTGPAGDRGKVLEFNMSDTTALARATSATLPIVAQLCSELDLTFCYLNQTREMPGVVYGPNVTTPGGKSMSFYADVRVQLTKKMEKDGKEVVGQTITAKALKAVTAPFKETTWLLSFEEDGDTVFDKGASLVEHLVEEGIIETPTKGYVTFGGQKYRKSALIAAIKQDPDGYNKLVAMLPK